MDILTTILLVTFFSVSSITITAWTISRKLGLNLGRMFFFVPVIIILSNVLILGIKTTWDIQTLNETTDQTIKSTLDEEWRLIENYAIERMEENFYLSETIGEKIISELNKYTPEQLDNYLELVGKESNNPIQSIVGKNIQNVYFRGIVSDSNDPFAMIIGKGLDDSFIFADFSENCSVNELTRNLYNEFELQSKNGNKELAVEAFTQLVNLKTGYPIEDSIFFQFNHKDGVPLKTFSWKGLKDTFYESKGDFELTFKSIEFLAPYYIYRDKSLGGTPRIVSRVKTDAKVLAIVSVFSLYEVVNQDYTIKTILLQKDNTIDNVKIGMIQMERILLVTGIFVMFISVIMFVVFWAFLHQNYLTREYERINKSD